LSRKELKEVSADAADLKPVFYLRSSADRSSAPLRLCVELRACQPNGRDGVSITRADSVQLTLVKVKVQDYCRLMEPASTSVWTLKINC
jgi:hypothetical protein